MPLTREDILKSQAPLEVKLELLRNSDEDFRNLSPKEQGSIIFRSSPAVQKTAAYLANNAPPEDESFLEKTLNYVSNIPEGFLERGGEILSNVASAPKLFADIFTDPLQPGYIEAQQRVQKAGEALKQRVSSQYQKGTEDIRRGDVTSGLARYIAATSNFIPYPPAQMISTAPDIAEGFTEDKPGQATADLAAALLPVALEAPGFGGAIKGAVKGAYRESVAPVPVPPFLRPITQSWFKTDTLPASVVGGLSGALVGSGKGLYSHYFPDFLSSMPIVQNFGPQATAVAGAAIPGIRGAFQGAAQGWREGGGLGKFTMPSFDFRSGGRPGQATATQTPLIGENTTNWQYGNRNTSSAQTPSARSTTVDLTPQLNPAPQGQIAGAIPPKALIAPTPGQPPLNVLPREDRVFNMPESSPTPQAWSGSSSQNKLWNAAVKVLGERAATDLFNSPLTMDAIKDQLAKMGINVPQDPLTTALGNFRKPDGVSRDPGQIEERIMAARRAITEKVVPALKELALTDRDLVMAKEERIDRFIRENKLAPQSRNDASIIKAALKASMNDTFEAIKEAIVKTGASRQGGRYTPSYDTIDALVYGLEE